MNLGLCIPVTHPVGAGLLLELDSHGWQGYRVDLSEAHRNAEDQLREARELPAIDFVFLLAHGTMRRLSGDPWGRGSLRAHVNDTCVKMSALGLFDEERVDGIAIEIGNEPDLAADPWKQKPELLAQTFSECYEVIRGYSPAVRVLTPCVSNLNARGIDYMQKMFDAGIPAGAECAIHRYPHRGQPDLPHEGFKSRDREVERMKEIIGGRPFHITETGFSEYEYRGNHTDPLLIADYFEREVAFWQRHGAASMFWYQFQDGRYAHEDEHGRKEATFGIRTVSGKWKPIVDRLRRMRGKSA